MLPKVSGLGAHVVWGGMRRPPTWPRERRARGGRHTPVNTADRVLVSRTVVHALSEEVTSRFLGSVRAFGMFFKGVMLDAWLQHLEALAGHKTYRKSMY